jgi:hypothetical protein
MHVVPKACALIVRVCMCTAHAYVHETQQLQLGRRGRGLHTAAAQLGSARGAQGKPRIPLLLLYFVLTQATQVW